MTLTFLADYLTWPAIWLQSATGQGLPPTLPKVNAPFPFICPKISRRGFGGCEIPQLRPYSRPYPAA